ncbi:MAG: hypothetical protein EKK37_17495 [Sphingobacteriales bacterium]|nr:MAG: hypothetical protein EKK37_17495 [Sphingobacteriales bacterium]
MRKIIFTLFITVSSITAFTQATTEIEYNYMKKGYKEVEEKGLDIKQGYTTEDITVDQQETNVTLTAKLLRRTADNTVAGIILKLVSAGLVSSETKYYAIPAVSLKTKKSFGWANWYKDLEQMNLYEKNAVAGFLSWQYSFQKCLK